MNDYSRLRHHINPSLREHPAAAKLEPIFKRGELRLLAEVELARERGEPVDEAARDRAFHTLEELAK